MASWSEIVEERTIGVCTDLTEKDAFDALDLLRKEGFRPSTILVSGVNVEIDVGPNSYHGLDGVRDFVKDVKYHLYPIYRKMERIGERLANKLDGIGRILDNNEASHYNRDPLSEEVDDAIALFGEMYADYEKLMGPANPDHKKYMELRRRLGEIKTRAETCAKRYDEMLEDRNPKGASEQYREVLYRLMPRLPSRPSEEPSLRELQNDLLTGARHYLSDVSSFRERYENEKMTRLAYLQEKDKNVKEAIEILGDLNIARLEGIRPTK